MLTGQHAVRFALCSETLRASLHVAAEIRRCRGNGHVSFRSSSRGGTPSPKYLAVPDFVRGIEELVEPKDVRGQESPGGFSIRTPSSVR